MIKWRLHRLNRTVKLWLYRHRRLVAIAGGGLVGLLIVAQILYPSDRLLPFAKVDNVSIGGWQKKDAAWELDQRYQKQRIQVVFGEGNTAKFTPVPADFGLSVKNEPRMDSLSYPWYVRLLPTSLLWYGAVTKADEPSYERDTTKQAAYTADTVGNSCDVAPKNAQLKSDDDAIGVEAAVPGGRCELDDVRVELSNVSPIVTRQTIVRIPVDVIPASITTDDAAAVADKINERIKNGVAIKAGDKTITADQKTVVSWLAFPSEPALTAVVDTEKAKRYFTEQITPNVAVTAGVTKVTTRDFQELSRSNGKPGRTLDERATAEAITKYIMGRTSEVEAVTSPLPPRVEYTRTYSSSDEGLSALIAQFAEDNPGTYGVQLVELSGERRRASVNESKRFHTASTYKLFVAYSVLRRVEAGQWRWNDQVTGGQTVSVCFDKMIVSSDNPCAEAMYKKIGYQTVINEARALGLTNTALGSDGQETTAGDLSVFLGSLYSGSIDINASSRARLIDAMKRNTYRSGIPAGSNGTVADKVGFLDGLLHDAAIVYSSKGNYVLVVMTDGSSWAKIAELTKKIEALR